MLEYLRFINCLPLIIWICYNQAVDIYVYCIIHIFADTDKKLKLVYKRIPYSPNAD